MLKNFQRKLIVIFLFIATVGSLQFTNGPKNRSKAITGYYLSSLDQLQEQLLILKKNIAVPGPGKKWKQAFLQTRLVYKKIAVLTEYFNQYETKSLNGPAIARIESEIPDAIIPPGGFQAIEDLIFNGNGNAQLKISGLIQDMIDIINRMKLEPDLEYKFKDELVWDAIRSAIISLMTNGITGLDSPSANYSLVEATGTIEGIQKLLEFFQDDIQTRCGNDYQHLCISLSAAQRILAGSSHFNRFNRLDFLTDNLNPVYKALVEIRNKIGIPIPPGRNAINVNATSIFDLDAFSINFYSPPEEYWLTSDRVNLGKLLFSDPILSGTNARSCASCHQPAKAFTDGLTKPFGLDNKTLLERNTPTLLNSGYQTEQFYDLRTDLLENQLGEVVHNIAEMKGSLTQSVKDLNGSDLYRKLFSKAYPEEKNPVNSFTIANAVSAYVRSLQSLNSRFDQYMRGGKSKLSPSEKNGFNLFSGKAKCATCHFIPLFNGVTPPFFAETESEVLGVPKTKSKRHPELDNDLGRFVFSGSAIHKYAFKTPTLRNIALTAPYMHNGVFSTLEEVLDFYNEGGGKGLKIAPENQTLPFDRLNLSKKEKRDIILFLKTLSGNDNG